MEINETEEYLGFLRVKKSMIEVQAEDAEEQIGVLHNVLDKYQNPEHGFSDSNKPAPSSSSSLDSDNIMDFHTLPYHHAWMKVKHLATVTDSPSIQLKWQKYMDDHFVEDLGEMSENVNDELGSDESSEKL